MRKRTSWLPVCFMLPATVAVTLFFLVPAGLTFVFSFTDMSAHTGILVHRYVVTGQTLARLAERGFEPTLIDKLGRKSFVIDSPGLEALRHSGLEAPLIAEIEATLRDRVYETERALFAELKALDNRPRSFAQRKAVARAVAKTVLNREFATEAAFRAGLEALGLVLDKAAFASLRDAAFTGWSWTFDNYRELAASQFTLKILANTVFYVLFTLLFNVGFALVLAVVTFYLPRGQSRLFRAVWLIPRISPSVIYVMLWKWFSDHRGFLSTVLALFGLRGENWLLEYPWTFVIVINGFVGASMGMIIFASAIEAIPKDLLRAAQVDGAYPWQQVRLIVLPMLAWPILFVTSYQTLSLLTSFEYIQLSTDGGPGFFTTETWALYAFHTALSSYFGDLRYGYGAALAIVLVVIGVAVSLLYLRLFDFKRLVAEPPIET